MQRRRVATAPQAVDFWPFGGMCLMAAVFFLYAVSGIVAPWWVTVVLLLVWVAAFAQCCAWWSTRPRSITVVALALTAVWFVVLVVGGVWLDWR